jgi:hypothetical protein
MGLSTSKATVKPYYDAEVKGAANTLSSVYNANQGNVQSAASTISALGNNLAQRFYQGDPTLKAASGYATDVLGGRYLTGNPQLQTQIDQTNADIANDVNAHLGTRGRTGGDVQASLLARELAKNESNLRYQDYSAERDRMANAAGLAPELTSAQYAAFAPAVSALQTGANLPTESATQYAAGIGGLLGQYVDKTEQDSAFNNLMKLFAASQSAAKAASTGGA